MATRAGRQRGILPVGPLLLIALGVALLLTNLGLLSWRVWPELIRLWPLILVLLGLQALVTGRVDWVSLLLLLAATALLSVAMWFVVSPNRVVGPLPTAQTIRQELRGASRAEVHLGFGAGSLQVDALDQPGLLATGELEAAPTANRLQQQYLVRDGVGYFELRHELGTPGRVNRMGRQDDPARLRLQLARSVPLDLAIDVAAAEADLDLSGLVVRNLRYQTGASRSSLILPAQGSTRAEVEAGAAALEIEIPPGVAARIRAAGSGLSRLQVDERRFPRSGEIYQSPGFASAEHRVDLLLNVGLASVEVR